MRKLSENGRKYKKRRSRELAVGAPRKKNLSSGSLAA
jgi:hypothetical protein